MQKKSFTLKRNSHGLADVPGFKLAGVSCDIRGKGLERLDLAVACSEAPCTAAGVFTRNRVRAAPVEVCQDALKAGGPFHAIVANSGNANACTGKRGLQDTLKMQSEVADHLWVEPKSVFVCSTGRIGEFLPMDKILAGIASATGKLEPTAAAGEAAADAILTSDTRRKVVSATARTSGGTIHLSGMAKGAGMIQPNMATMLAFLATDAAITRVQLQKLLSEAVDSSFNAITVDGDMSTNDTVLLLANGTSGIALKPANKEDWDAFRAALLAVCQELAEKIVGDGEKISKVVELKIDGARNRDDAEKIARAIGNSLLVKSSWFGEDPNWGRLLDSAGYAGADLEEAKLELYYQGSKGKPVPAFLKGNALPQNKPKWKAIVQQPRFTIHLNLNLGKGAYRLLATDLTEAYVNFNKSE